MNSLPNQYLIITDCEQAFVAEIITQCLGFLLVHIPIASGCRRGTRGRSTSMRSTRTGPFLVNIAKQWPPNKSTNIFCAITVFLQRVIQ